MPPMGFEPTVAVLERAKTVRALDRDRQRKYKAITFQAAETQSVERCRDSHIL
jgi:hypothetical protein